MRLWLPLSSALVVLALAPSAGAQQITVSFDQVPDAVVAGEEFSVVWTVSASQPVDATTILWGTEPDQVDQNGAVFAGAAGQFQDTLTAPGSAGTLYWRVFVRVGQQSGATGVRSFPIQPAPPVPPPTPPSSVEVAVSPGLDIPDDLSAGVSSSLRVVQTGQITGLEVDVDIDHSYRGDLQIFLTSPQGTRVELYRGRGTDSSNDLEGTFGQDLTPRESLNAFLGEEVQGSWQLTVADRQSEDTGELRSWGLRAAISGGQSGGSFGLQQRERVQGLAFPLSGQVDLDLLEFRPAFPALSFDSPILITHAPDGSDRLFVVEQAGRIRVFPNTPQVQQAGVFLDIRNRVRDGGEEGLLGLAFDPGYAQNGRLYVHYTRAGSPRRSVVASYQVSQSDPDRAEFNSEQVLLEIPQPFSNHNGGMLAFGPDGYLYVGLGDGGSGGDPRGNGQDRGTLLGSILRIDPNGAAPYAIPADNPFVNVAGARGEIWAYGIRNPWRFSFDRATGDLWLGDVGQGEREEVDIVRRGANLGWKVYEGNARFDNPQGLPASSFVPPVVDYPRSMGSSVIGGYVYRGDRYPGLRGTYFYGDFGSGRVWALEYDGSQVLQNEQVDFLSSLTSFGEDAQGELYAVLYTGQIRVLEVTGAVGGAFPQSLSDTGLFQDTATLTPAPGVIEYTPSASSWSDRAHKRQWLALPGLARIGFDANQSWSYPLGTVLVQQLDLDMQVGNPGSARRLETRVLIHEQGGWAGYTYRWNDAQTDAVLQDDQRQEQAFTIFDLAAPGGQRVQSWTFPSRGACMACHNQAAGFVLGLNTRQLNGEFAYPTMSDNQLRSWNHIELFDQNVGDPTSLPAAVDPEDPSADLEERARSYLAVNCAQCHQPGGPVPVSMDLRAEIPLNQANLVGSPPQAGNLGLSGALRVRAGNKESSVLWERLRRLDYSRMPPLGSVEIDQTGVDLIGRWIDQLP